jgi:hypothetical protein
MRGGVSGHFRGGMLTGALPDGRKAFEAVADGNLSPARGMDTKGPTAVILSTTRVNQTEHSLTTLLNMNVMPSIVETREGIKKVIALIKTLFDRGGWHIQFNMLDHQTLLDAQEHPEIHKSLATHRYCTSEENLRGIARAVASVGRVEEVDLLGYHRLGLSKYQMLGREYVLGELKPLVHGDLEKYVRVFESFGLATRVGCSHVVGKKCLG